MVDRIADSIDAVLESVGAAEGGPSYDDFSEHAEKSVKLQKLALSHISRFFASDMSIPERVQVIVLHSFWLGFEAGRAAALGEKMEAIFQ